MIKGFIFDFDGLILDTEGPILQSWQELYQSYGSQISLEDWGKIVGSGEVFFDPVQELERRVGRELDWEKIEPDRRLREQQLIASETPLPGVSELLHAAKQAGIKVALASSSTCDWVEGHLGRLGLIDYFDFLLASNDVDLTKPDPELFLSALQAMNLEPSEVVVFEDSPNGVLAANRAGIFVVAVPNAVTREMSLENADLCLDSLAGIRLEELLELIQQKQSA
jgi:HAD superfamily hydrolase (TIGR01509 family)